MEDITILWHPSRRGFKDNQVKNNAFEAIGLVHLYLHDPLLQDLVDCESLLKLMAERSQCEIASLFI